MPRRRRKVGVRHLRRQRTQHGGFGHGHPGIDGRGESRGPRRSSRGGWPCYQESLTVKRWEGMKTPQGKSPSKTIMVRRVRRKRRRWQRDGAFPKVVVPVLKAAAKLAMLGQITRAAKQATQKVLGERRCRPRRWIKYKGGNPKQNKKNSNMSWRIQRQRPFLQSVLNEVDGQTRRERFQAANGDQINVVSELVMNILRQRVPVSSRTLQQLHPHRQALWAMGRPQLSIKTVGIGCVVRSQDGVQ